MEPTHQVSQLRVVIEAEDYDAAVAFYRDVLGMPELAAFSEGDDDRVVILDAGRATLELANPTHKRFIDDVEAEGQASPKIRLALEVADSPGATNDAVEHGAALVAAPRLTPWQSINSRLDAPAGVQITLFQETLSPEERSTRDGFGTDS